MGSASSIKYIPDELTEDDCKVIAGDKYKRHVYKRLSENGVVTKKKILDFLQRVDVYFIYLWRGVHDAPSETSRKVKLVRNMIVSYGLLAWTTQEHHSTLTINTDSESRIDSKSVDDASAIAIFITTEFFQQQSLSFLEIKDTSKLNEGDLAQRALMKRDLEHLISLPDRRKLILIVFETEMLDRGNWGIPAMDLFPENTPVVDITGDLEDSHYLSERLHCLHEELLKIIDTPHQAHPIRNISVTKPYVRPAGRRQSIQETVLRHSIKTSLSAEVALSPVENSTRLFSVYNSLTGELWRNNTNWCSNQPIDTWFGIGISESGSIAKMTLRSNNLRGELPVDLFRLTNLRSLVLSNNQLMGSIPKQISNLQYLHVLSMSHNKLCGDIPLEMSGLRSLVELHLNDNSFDTGFPIGICLLNDLIELDISNNKLHYDLPPEIGRLTRLRSLYLNGNELTGTIPDEISQMKELVSLNLSSNRFSGHIPASLSLLTKLESIHLNGNNLTEHIPSDLTHLKELTLLDLSDNKLTGVVPKEFSCMAKLAIIRLSCNRLVGVIPKVFNDLKCLEELCMFNNSLAGAVSIEICFMPSLVRLRLGLNKLSGIIPIEISQLVTLKELCLNNNKLSGEIPKELSALTLLQELRLNDNLFESCTIRGAIPPELCNLTALEVLTLHNNKLAGAIPYDVSKLVSLQEIHATGNSRLSTTIDDLKFLLPNCPNTFI